MFSLHFFVTVLLLTMCAFGCNCSYRRIIGSQKAPPGKFPYQVSVQVRDKFHYCTGSIINNRYILSVAHCRYHKEDTKLLSALVGTNDWKDVKRTGVRYQIKDYIVHDGYDWTLDIYDIVLLETVEKMEFNKLVAPIALGKYFVGSGVEVILSGWGARFPDEVLAPELHYVKLRTLSNEECEKAASQAASQGRRSHRPLTKGHLCTSTENGIGFCRQDSGNGLVNLDNDKLIGLASRRMDGYKKDCASGLPDIFTRVSEYVKWVEKKTGNRF